MCVSDARLVKPSQMFVRSVKLLTMQLGPNYKTWTTMLPCMNAQKGRSKTRAERPISSFPYTSPPVMDNIDKP